MMHGHKGELFVLYLSFLGWDLLSLLPRGELARMDSALVEAHYDPERAKKFRGER